MSSRGGSPDGIVDMSDLREVAFRWGSSTGDLLYNAVYDRSPAPPEGNAVALGPPDGTIAMDDILAVLSQFGDECRGPISETIDLDAECDIVVAAGAAGEEVVTENGDSVTQCFLINNPVTGDLLDVRKVVFANQGPTHMGNGTEPGPAGGSVAVGYYRCEKTYRYESYIFQTDLAVTTVTLDFYIIETLGPYYAAVGELHAKKSNSAVSPWSITFWNTVVDTFYADIYNAYRLAAYTFTGFRYSITIPIPLLPDVTITKDMEIHVQTVGGLDTQGTATTSDDEPTCWNSGYHT